MRRREFITLLGGAAAAWPLAARAQQPERMRRIGVLLTLAADDPEGQARIAAFCRRWSNWAGPTAAMCGSTSAGARATPSAFANTRRNWSRSRRTSSWPLAIAVGPLLQATRTVPIVFAHVADPVGAGFVESLARPGGNATGFTLFEYGMSGKWLELLKQIAPGVTRAAVLRDPDHSFRGRPVRRNPGCGAVARGGGEPGQRARRRRDRARRRGFARASNGGLIVTASALASSIAT